MITQETLNILLKDTIIKEITSLGDDIGLSDLRLFVTHEFADRDKIHLLGKSTIPALNLFLIQEVEEQIAELLKCKTVVRAEHMLNKLVKEEVMTNTVIYTVNNKKNIKSYFEKTILPFAQMNAEEFFRDEESEEEQIRSDTPHEILETLKKEHPILWEKIQRNPQALRQAVDLFSQQYQQQTLMASQH